jgi:RNA polymerase sigma-70 factor (ECF subfamily)
MRDSFVDEHRMDDSETLRESIDTPDLFAAFFDHHIRDVLAYFQRRVADPSLAADLAAETFAKAFALRARYRDEGVPVAWLFGIAKNELRHAIRQGSARNRARAKLGLTDIQADDLSLERIEELVDFEPTRRIIRSAMSGLSKGTATAVWLRIGEERSYEEIARLTGCSVGAARVRVSRGLKQLVGAMENGGK